MSAKSFELPERQQCPYRIFFDSNILGEIAGSPEILFDNGIRNCTVYDSEDSEVEFMPASSNRAEINIKAADISSALQLLNSSPENHRGTLLLEPVPPHTGVKISFNNSELLPRGKLVLNADKPQYLELCFVAHPDQGNLFVCS